MANKCLLSLLVVISITTLCKVNANVTSCYVGEGPIVNSQTCSENQNVGCYRYNGDEFTSFGCVENEEIHDDLLKEFNLKITICKEDNCNTPQ